MSKSPVSGIQGRPGNPAEQKTSAPLVSIIVNTLNGEDTLAEALDSVITQTFEDWELILFDDLSTDSTLEIFNSYHDPRFRLAIAEKPLDLARAREAALKSARGEWFAFLDQDDIWTPDKLERQLQLVQSDDSKSVGLIYGRAERFGWIDKNHEFDHHFEGQLLPEGRIFHSLATISNFITQSSGMIRREAYESIDCVPESVSFCPDFYFWMAISRNWEVRALQDTCCYYRVKGNDFTSNRSIQIFKELYCVIDYFGKELDPRVLKRRKRECHNLIAVSEIANGRKREGLARILKHGSIFHIANRTIPYLTRTVRQWLRSDR